MRKIKENLYQLEIAQQIVDAFNSGITNVVLEAPTRIR